MDQFTAAEMNVILDAMKEILLDDPDAFWNELCRCYGLSPAQTKDLRERLGVE